MKQPKYILKQGTGIRTAATLGSTTGMTVHVSMLANRQADQPGVIQSPVGGHGGDVYWVAHGSDGSVTHGSVAPYCFSEFSLDPTSDESSRPPEPVSKADMLPDRWDSTRPVVTPPCIRHPMPDGPPGQHCCTVCGTVVVVPEPVTEYNTSLGSRSPTDTPPEHWANPAPYRSRTEALEALAEILRWTTHVLSDGIMPNTTRPTMALGKLDAMYRHELAGVEALDEDKRCTHHRAWDDDSQSWVCPEGCDPIPYKAAP